MNPIFDHKKTELTYQPIGDDRPRKQTLAYLDKDAEDESVVAFAVLMNDIAPEEESVKQVAIIEKRHFAL